MFEFDEKLKPRLIIVTDVDCECKHEPNCDKGMSYDNPGRFLRVYQYGLEVKS